MTVKEKVLELLESSKDIYISGEQLAQGLNVSRAAIWKAIKTLRSDGYQIDAITNKGYSLSVHSDILSPQGIGKYLNSSLQDLTLEVVSETESTNSLLRQKANSGAPEGYTIIANHQSRGRGRSGRNFYSPPNTGIYLSTLLRPLDCSASQAVRMTTTAAVAMCEAIEEVCGLHPTIKWVNDIFVNGKKVCGILTEGAISLETGLLDYAVLGVGINVYPPQGGFPEELQNIAGSLYTDAQDDIKNKLSAAFLLHFFSCYRSGNHQEIVDKYRNYSMVIGKEILVLQNGQELRAHADDIDEECRLLVTFPDDSKKALSYGEIRILLP